MLVPAATTWSPHGCSPWWKEGEPSLQRRCGCVRIHFVRSKNPANAQPERPVDPASCRLGRLFAPPKTNDSLFQIDQMVDTRSPEQRSYIMKSVGIAHTGPEILVRSVLHELGYRFRLHPKNLPGRPDIILPRLKTAIFVHGCFWHGHRCRKGRPPKSREDYWLPKISGNKARDRRNLRSLNSIGWRHLVIWQCKTRERKNLQRFLQEKLKKIEKTGLA